MTHILLHALMMGVLVWGVVQLMPTLWLKLIVGIITGITYYLSGAWIMRFLEMKEVIAIVKRKKH